MLMNIPKINNCYVKNSTNEKVLTRKEQMIEQRIMKAEQASQGVVAGFLNNLMGDFFNSLLNSNFDGEDGDGESMETEDNAPNHRLLEHLNVEFGNILAKSREMKQLRDMITLNVLSGEDRAFFKKKLGMEVYNG